MSDDVKAGSAAPDDAASSAHEEKKQEGTDAAAGVSDSVKYETYARKKKQADNERAGRIAAEQRAERLEQDKLEAEGKKDEVIAHLKKRNEDLAKRDQERTGSFAYTALEKQVEAEAAKLGCVDTEALVTLMDMKSFVDGMDTETWKANSEELKMAIEEQKQKRAYLFSKAGPKINNKDPKAEFTQEKKAVSDMSQEDQDKLIRDIDKREGKTLGW